MMVHVKFTATCMCNIVFHEKQDLLVRTMDNCKHGKDWYQFIQFFIHFFA